jgi:valacyclovir hydrolase
VYGPQTQEIWSKHVKFCQSLSNICKDQVSGVRCPTLVLYGDKDFVEVDEVKYLIKNISDTQTYRFPEGKHDMHLGFTDEFNSVVDKFLRE